MGEEDENKTDTFSTQTLPDFSYPVHQCIKKRKRARVFSNLFVSIVNILLFHAS